MLRYAELECDSVDVMRKLSVKLLCALILTASTQLILAQPKQLTEAEALSAIELATNPSTKLAAAEEFS